MSANYPNLTLCPYSSYHVGDSTCIPYCPTRRHVANVFIFRKSASANDAKPVVSDTNDEDLDLSSLSAVSVSPVSRLDEPMGDVDAAAADEKAINTQVATPEQDQDDDMADVATAADANDVDDDDEEEPLTVSYYPKRKRTLKDIEDDLDDNDGSTIQGEDTMVEEPTLATVANVSRVKRHGSLGVKGVIIGSWRDSTAPNYDERHAVIGFIDIRERLRTRIQPTDMKGNAIDLSVYPIPAGPGGSWVTFTSILFEKYLVGLDQFQIKEFVRIRSEADPNETPEQKIIKDKKAVKEAIRRVAANPPPDTPTNAQPAVAYGEQIPDYVREADDQKKKRRRLGSSTTTNTTTTAAAAAAANANTTLLHNQQLQTSHQAGPTASASRTPPGERAIQPAPTVASPMPIAPGLPHLPTTTLNNLSGTRPTRIFLGTWTHSSEAKKSDRHAVFGILGVNDMFRVKVVRETQDGRFMDGNFPSGAGALWITYDQVQLDDALVGMNRAEVKEYVRYRQFQIDQGGETNKNRDENIRIAVEQAKLRWDSFEKKNEALREEDMNNPAGYGGPPPFGLSQQPGTPESRNGLRSSMRDSRENGDSRASAHGGPHIAPSPVHEQPVEASPAKLDGRTKAGRLAKQQAAAAAAARREAEANVAAMQMGNRHIEPRPTTRSRKSSADAIERTNHLAQREVARAEANAKRRERHEVTREHRSMGGAPGHGGPTMGHMGGRSGTYDGIERLDKVWQVQEANRINKYQAEDAIFHAGIKYERRPNGPFAGKLVSHGAILNIDGEDYVEYRVLLKPTF